jgi:hypothetical protein
VKSVGPSYAFIVDERKTAAFAAQSSLQDTLAVISSNWKP